MAVAIIGELPGGTAEMDEAMLRELNLSPQSPAPGALARLAGPVEGGWRIMSVWESQEAWDSFRRDRLEPFFRQAGGQMPPYQVWELHSFMVAPAAQPGSRS